MDFESNYYGLWNCVLFELIEDLTSDFFVIPHHTIYDLSQDLANSTNTISGTTSNDAIPDFVVVAGQLFNRNDSSAIPLQDIAHISFDSWHNYQLLNVHVRVIVELKRPPTRRAETPTDFQFELEKHMKRAYQQLRRYAELGFKADLKINKLILFAACGEWWTWQQATRSHFQTPHVETDNEKQPDPQDGVQNNPSGQ
ncbi:hypothetical protein AX17_004880, partial [Amanita inopinata Kibby_2008]